MLDAISAETTKLLRHRATWFLVWIYPVGIIFAFILAVGHDFMRQSPQGAPVLAAKWIEQTTAVWYVPAYASVLVGAFAALVFAGEYSWNTWKLVVPHRRRSVLMAAKYATMAGLLFAAFILTAGLTIFLTWLEDFLTGDPMPTGITLAALAEAHWLQALAALGPLLWTMAYTSLAAILTRSMLAALTISLVFDGVEGLFRGLAGQLSTYAPDLVLALYRGLPGYHLANLESWIVDGVAVQTRFPTGAVVEASWPVSLAVAASWIIGIVALAMFRFQRQDIN